MDDREHEGLGNPDVATGRPRGRHESMIAWSFVTIQLVLIALVVFAPRGESWTLPSAIDAATTVGTWTGIGLMALAAAALGRGLTPAPLPNAHAQLCTDGLYRFVRHPIYTGLLLFTASQVLSSSSVPVDAAGVALLILINVKARWEEQRLSDRFADYSEYARQTPGFVPGWPTR